MEEFKAFAIVVAMLFYVENENWLVAQAINLCGEDLQSCPAGTDITLATGERIVSDPYPEERAKRQAEAQLEGGARADANAAALFNE